MPPAHRRTDIGSGHACHFPPTPATGGSPNVYVNGKKLMRVGDEYVPHGCAVGHAPAHGRKLKDGSPTVYVNGRRAGRIGDPIDCGGEAQTGSDNVYIGDRGPGSSSKSSKAACQKGMAQQSMPFIKG